MRTRFLAFAIAAGIGLTTVSPSDAATSRIAVHFDLTKGQQPENIALAPDGTAYVTFAAARQVAAISPKGTIRILATLPAPADGGAPALGFALTTGIVRTADGTLYFLYASGDPATTGLYRLRPGRKPQRITALPGTACPTAWPTTNRRRPSTSPTRSSAPSPPCRCTAAPPGPGRRHRNSPRPDSSAPTASRYGTARSWPRISTGAPVGWSTRLVDDEWVPTFPNATYLMSAADFHHWNPDNNPGIPGSINEYAFEDSITPVHAAGQVHLWEDSYVIDGNLRLEAAPGHTPGHAVIKLESNGDRALFASDIIHTPLQLRHHHHGSCFCEDPVQARATRRRLLDWAADTTALVLPAHFSGRSALEIERRAESYTVREWAPFSRY